VVFALKAHAPDVRARALALRGVDQAALAPLRDRCVAGLEQRADALESLARSPLRRNVAILDAFWGPRLTRPCTRPGRDAQSYWSPDFAAVKAAEDRLPAYVAATRGCAKRFKPLAEYRRQYVGVVVDGRRRLYLNAYEASSQDEMQKLFPGLRENPPDWRMMPYDMCHGGPAFWGAEYDLDKATFSNLECSGGGPTSRP
jgi:hypothetical protein